MVERLRALLFFIACIIVLLCVSGHSHSQSKSRVDQLAEELFTHQDKLKDDTTTVWK